jgi:hypothetical protein
MTNHRNIAVIALAIAALGVAGCGSSGYQKPTREEIGHEMVLSYCAGAVSRAQYKGCIEHVAPGDVTVAAQHRILRQIGQDEYFKKEIANCDDPACP